MKAETKARIKKFYSDNRPAILLGAQILQDRQARKELLRLMLDERYQYDKKRADYEIALDYVSK